jgi:hypothetical protein
MTERSSIDPSQMTAWIELWDFEAQSGDDEPIETLHRMCHGLLATAVAHGVSPSDALREMAKFTEDRR